MHSAFEPPHRQASSAARAAVPSAVWWVAFCAAAVAVAVAFSSSDAAAHAGDTAAANNPAVAGSAASAQATLHTPALPVVARYRVTLIEPAATPRDAQDWTFVREANRIAIGKGNVEELWLRAPNGSISLQRVFHDEQRVIDYPAGELRALGVAADWAALASFVDPQADRSRCPAATNANTADPDPVCAWNADAQLPAHWTQTLPRGASVRYVLIGWLRTAPPDWPMPGVRGADYLHIDAADFGDMPYDPAVRKAEALDIRAGWRGSHGH